MRRPTGYDVRATNTNGQSSSSVSPVSVPPPPSSHDSIKDISDLFNRIKNLDGEAKEQAAAYLKDLTTNMDF